MPVSRKRKPEIISDSSRAETMVEQTNAMFLDLPDEVLCIIINLMGEFKSSIRLLSSRLRRLTKGDEARLHLRSGCPQETISSFLTTNVRDLTLAQVEPLLLQTITKQCPQLQSLSVFRFAGALNAMRLPVNKSITKLVMRPYPPQTWPIPEWVFPKLPALTELHLSHAARMSAPDVLSSVASLPLLEKLIIGSSVSASVDFFTGLFSSLSSLRELELASLNWKNQHTLFADAIACLPELCPQFESLVIRETHKLQMKTGTVSIAHVVPTLLEKLPRLHTFWVPSTQFDLDTLPFELSRRLRCYWVPPRTPALADGRSYATNFPYLTDAECDYDSAAPLLMGCDYLHTLILRHSVLLGSMERPIDLEVFPALRKLTITPQIGEQKLMSILEFATHLEYLEIPVPTPDPTGNDDVVEAGFVLPNLKTLKFIFPAYLDSAADIHPLIALMPNLEELFLTGDILSSKFVPRTPMHALRLLEVTVHDAKALCLAISKYCRNLHELRFSRGTPLWKRNSSQLLNDDCLVKVLQGCSLLRRLAVDDCQLLTHVGLEALFKYGLNLDVVILPEVRKTVSIPPNTKCWVLQAKFSRMY